MNAPDEIGIVCPKCGAFNTLRAPVCVRCASHLDGSSDVADSPTELSRADRIIKAHEEASFRIPTLLRRQNQRSKTAIKLVQWLGISVLTLLVILWIWNRIQVLRWEGQISAIYQDALTCLEAERYLCARDKVLYVINEAPNYPEASDTLIAARWGLAQRYAAENQWEQAAAELENLMEYADNQPEVRAAFARTYEERIRSAQERGDFGEIIRLNLDRLAKLGF